MEQPLAVLMAFLGVGAVVFGLCSSLAAFFPRLVRLSRRAAEESPGRSLLLGVVNSVFFGAVSLTLLAAGEGRGAPLTVLGAVILAIAASALAIGLSGVVTLVGARLMRRPAGLSEILVGTIVLVLASATPFLGWFVFLPALISLGLGAFILGWARRRAWADEL